jgi:cell division protein FtsB
MMKPLVKMLFGALLAVVIGMVGFFGNDVYATLDKKQDISTADAQYEDIKNRVTYLHEEMDKSDERHERRSDQILQEIRSLRR